MRAPRELTLGAETTEIAVGETVQLTATGHLAEASAINLTQQVEYTSSDPAVAIADNTAGDRSRIVPSLPGPPYLGARPGNRYRHRAGGTVTLTVTAP